MFLPDDYNVPSQPRGYMKFEEGINRFRVMSSPILGWEWWEEDKDGKHPKRVKRREEIPSEAWIGKQPPKHFWALKVYNYRDKAFQILEITQQTIQGPITELARNEKWGDPREYDIVVKKQGEGLETQYTVMPEPKSGLPLDIKEEFSNWQCNLEALYEGKDPFNNGFPF